MEIVDAAAVAKGSTPGPQNSGKMCSLVAEIRKRAVVPWKIHPRIFAPTVPLRSAGLAANAPKSMPPWFAARKTSEIQSR
jgi:hypothetical protein